MAESRRSHTKTLCRTALASLTELELRHLSVLRSTHFAGRRQVAAGCRNELHVLRQPPIALDGVRLHSFETLHKQIAQMRKVSREARLAAANCLFHLRNCQFNEMSLCRACRCCSE